MRAFESETLVEELNRRLEEADPSCLDDDDPGKQHWVNYADNLKCQLDKAKEAA